MEKALWSNNRGSSLRLDSPLLYLHTHTTRDGIPRGMSLTVNEAESLAGSLLSAATALREAMPRSCKCGEPIESDAGRCVECELVERRIEAANADPAPPLDARIQCPIDWCEGWLIDHGGDGSDPSQWVHVGPMHPLPLADLESCDGYTHRVRFGSGPTRWFIEIDISGSGHDPKHVAASLSQTATALVHLEGADHGSV